MADTGMITAPDGVDLAVRVSGSGPPLVLVHGSVCDKDDWVFVEPLLAESHTVWVYDRRGRGDSGDAEEHAMSVEASDLRAVLAEAGTGAHLVGHSFGACVALEVARDHAELASLVVYEPPVHAGRHAEPTDRALALYDAGDAEGALTVFMAEAAGISEDEIAMARSVPEAWRACLMALPPVAREAAALAERAWDPARYAGISVPTLLVTGELTDRPAYLTPDELRTALPRAEHAELAGQRHIAVSTDPGSFAAVVLDFAARAGRA